MSELSKQQLGVENSNSFPNNNTGYITPAILRTFNQNMIDSLVDEVSYNADSASWEADIQQLQQFSSSLVTDFATVAQLNQSSSTLQSNINAKLNTASYQADSASFNSRINSVTGSAPAGTVSSSAQIVGLGFLQTSSFNQYTASAASGVSASINSATQSLSASIAVTDLAQSASIAQLLGFSSSLDATFATDAQLSASVSALSSSIAVTDNAQSASIAALQQFSSSLDATFATDTQLSASASTLQTNINNLSSSVAVTTNLLDLEVNQKLDSSSFNTYTASAASNVSGAINTATGSSLVTASISGDIITFTKGNGSTFPIQIPVASGSVPGGTISSSAQIAELGYATTSSVSQSVSALNAATSSYITSAQTASMTVLSASFAETASFLLGTVASASFATTASFAVTSSLAQNVVIIARNDNASTLAAGTIVHITGASGDNPIFNTASYDSEALSANTLGVLRQSAATGADVDVLVNGIVTGVNTDPALGFVAGDILYLSSSGQFTRVQPQAPKQIVVIGQVLRAQQNNGSVYVNISNGWELDELHNVAINGVADGDLLVYRSAESLWTNSSSAELGLVNTSSFNSYTQSNDSKVNALISATGSYATTASNTFIGNQIISGNLLVTGSNINLEVDAPALGGAGTTNIKAVLDMTASGVITSVDVTRQAAGATGDLTGVRLQTFSGSSETSGDRVISRVTTGVNRHTTLGLSASVVNTIMTSTWATGSSAFTTQIVANAQSGSATLTLSAGQGATNAGGTASLSAGLIRIGGNSVHKIAPTGSFTNITIDTGVNGVNALSIKSGSVEVTTPQGSGSFYTNLPITSSNGRINGYFITKNLIVSGTEGGSPADTSGSAWIEGWVRANEVTASLVSASTYIGLPSGIVSASGVVSSSTQISGLGFATTGSNNFIGNQTISGSTALTGSAPTHTFLSGGVNYSGSLVSTATDTYPQVAQGNFIVTLNSASMATLLSTAATNANTLYFVI